MVDRLSQLHYRGETGPLQGLAAQDTEPAFDLVKPRGMSGGVMKMNVGMTRSPTIMLGLMGIQIVYDHVQVQIRIGGHQTVHKVQELPPTAARVMSRTHLAAQHLQGSEKGGRAVAFIFMAEPLQGLSAGQAQPTLSP